MDSRIVVIQTVGGKEDKLVAYLENSEEAGGLVSEIFFPKRQLMKFYYGKWNKVTERLFPGYLFVETKDPQKLYMALKKIPMLSKLLGDSEYNYITLSEEEEDFIRSIGGGRGDHCFGISTVQIMSDLPYKKGDQVNILSGDLKDFEGEIVGFNFKKRKAMIKTKLFGETVIHVGIDFLQKK